MKKNIEKVLKGLAGQLPKTSYNALEVSSIKGENVKLSGLELPQGMEIEEGKEYKFKVPVIIQSSHSRRIRRAYKSSGIEGVVKYVLQFVKDEHRSRVQADIENVLKSVA